MTYGIVDKLMDGIDNFKSNLRAWTKADHTQYFPIACPQNRYALSLHNGSLLSVIRIDGYMGQYFPHDFSVLQKKWNSFLKTTANDKSAAGFDLYWSYEYDPDGMKGQALEYRARMINAAKKRGLDIQDILEEEAHVYGDICAIESQYILVVTHLDALPKVDRKEALNKRREAIRGQLKGSDSIVLGAGIAAIESAHESHVNKIQTFLENTERKYVCERLETYEALKAMRCAFDPSTAGSGWAARLKPSDTRFRSTDSIAAFGRDNQKPDGKVLDWSAVFPPKLASQMIRDNVVDLGLYSVVGDRTYAPLYVDELAVDPEPLHLLLNMCFKSRLPLRLVYSLTSDSAQANYWNKLFASIFTFASKSNRQITKAVKAMESYEESGGGAIFGYGISVTTWAKTDVTYQGDGSPIYATTQIQKRARELETYMQQWGGQQLNNIFGCAVEAVMSATPGYMIPSATPLAPQFDLDITTQLPIMRPARIWSPDNSIWLRSSDGVLLPYQPFSPKQTAMLTLVMGGMGYGKSNLISEHIYYFANHPEAEDIPYIRGMDFGASSSGVIDMISASLPENQRHRVIFQPFTNNGTMIKNMMDTRLGCRYPLEDHAKFLVNWLLILCDSLIKEAGVPNLMAVLNAAIKRAYEKADNKHHSYIQRKFEADYADPLVIKMLDRIEYKLDQHTNYWEVTDALSAWGLANNDNEVLHAAKLAQRHAVPQFTDLIEICDSLSQQFKDMPDILGKPLPAAVSNALMNANGQFPCFSGVTNTDVSEAPVCVFDMSEAFGRGTSEYDDWLRSVYFAVVYRLLTEDLFVNRVLSGAELENDQDKLGLSDELLDWHLAFLAKQDQAMKVYWGDELHRVGKVKGAFDIIDSMAFEGRKYKVGIMLGTQMPEHFPPNMLKLAESVFIFGVSQSEGNADVVKELFGLSDDERSAILNITKPSQSKGAEVFCIHKTEVGTQRLKLHFQMGGIKRWGFATEAEERGLRGLLYAEGPSTSWAREILAKRVPSVNKAIDLEISKNPELSKPQAIRLIADKLLATLT